MPPSTEQVRAKLPAPHQLHTHTTPPTRRQYAKVRRDANTTRNYVRTNTALHSKRTGVKKKTQTRKFPTLASKRTVHAKRARGKPHESGALHARLSDKNANTNSSNSCKQEDCSKNRPRFSLLGGHTTGAPLPAFRSRAAKLVPSSEFAP